MPTGPKGEKRPADAIARAVKVMRIARRRRAGGLRQRTRQEPSRRRARPQGREEARREHNARAAR